MRVTLPAPLAVRISELARAAAPRECCGLLEGFCADGTFQVEALHPARNLADGLDRFEIAPEDHFAAQKAARKNGRRIIGCYHSHPGGRAEPSDTDRAGAHQEGFLWLIANGATLNAFVYREGKFRGCVTGADWVTSSE